MAGTGCSGSLLDALFCTTGKIEQLRAKLGEFQVLEEGFLELSVFPHDVIPRPALNILTALINFLGFLNIFGMETTA